jgi:hypothetical protein
MEKLAKEGFYGFTCRPKALLSVLTFQVPESNDNPSFFDSLMVPKRVNDFFFLLYFGPTKLQNQFVAVVSQYPTKLIHQWFHC